MISIIVPVYNVEQYLMRCVRSIFRQTYTNYEIILVDDGSTDHSGYLCDEIQKEYREKKIIVIHQKNGGLSSARNTGIQDASGNYLMFLDSDDYLDPFCIEALYKNLIECRADISSCNYLRTEKDNVPQAKVMGRTVWSGEEKIVYYLQKELYSAWGKLYKREVFSMLRFPVGKLNEDIYTIYQAFLESKCIVHTDSKLYNYYRNPRSITTGGFKMQKLDLLEAYQAVCKSSQNASYKVQKLAKLRYEKGYFTLLGNIAYQGVSTNVDKMDFLEIRAKLLKHFQENILFLLLSPLISINRKAAMVLFFIDFDACCRVGDLLRKIKTHNLS